MLFRGRHLTAGRPWPVLTSRTFGARVGWRRLLTRSAYLTCTVGLAAYGGILAGLTTGSTLANVGTVVVLGIVGVALLPSLTVDSRRARAARLGYYLLGLVPALVVLSRFPPEAHDPGIQLPALLVFALIALDTGSFLRRIHG